jgi:hypothetical protein
VQQLELGSSACLISCVTRSLPAHCSTVWLQLYEVPPWFTDDWLNKYYDGLLAAQRGNHVDDDSVMDASLPHEQEEQGEADIDDAPDSNMCSGSTSSQGQGPGQEVAEVADYRFVYLGPAGSWTPLHSDVLRSHSWSANVAGRKRQVPCCCCQAHAGTCASCALVTAYANSGGHHICSVLTVVHSLLNAVCMQLAAAAARVHVHVLRCGWGHVGPSLWWALLTRCPDASAGSSRGPTSTGISRCVRPG